MTNRLGQVTAEYILLGVVLLAMYGLVTKTIKDNNYLLDIQQTPQKLFKNFVENGNIEEDKAQSQGLHPNQFKSQYSSKKI